MRINRNIPLRITCGVVMSIFIFTLITMSTDAFYAFDTDLTYNNFLPNPVSSNILQEVVISDAVNIGNVNVIKNSYVPGVSAVYSADESKRLCAEFLLQKGYNKVCVSAIMGNWQVECRFVCTAIEYFNKSEIARGKPQPREPFDWSYYQEGVKKRPYGYGLAQWTTEGRKRGLQSFLDLNSYPYDSLEAQLEYFWVEVNSNYYSKCLPDVMNSKFSTSASVEEASNYFNKYYEGGTGSSSRRDASRQIYSELTQGETSQFRR